MNIKGVNYDVGTEMGVNWRPDYDPEAFHRELEIIKNYLSVPVYSQNNRL